MAGTILRHTEHPLGCTRKGAGGKILKGNSGKASQDFQSHDEPHMAYNQFPVYYFKFCFETFLFHYLEVSSEIAHLKRATH